MTSSIIGFSLAEKLAIVQAIDSVILADGTVHKGEINVLSKLMYRIDFDSNFIVQARNISDEQRSSIVKGMSEDKKKALAEILDEVAKADGFVHKKEIALILDICAAMGICMKVHSAL